MGNYSLLDLLGENVDYYPMIDYTKPEKHQKPQRRKASKFHGSTTNNTTGGTTNENTSAGYSSTSAYGNQSEQSSQSQLHHGQGGASTAQYSANTSVASERSILKRVYLWMTAGLLLTGAVSVFTAGSESIQQAIWGSPFAPFALFIGQIVLVMVLSARIRTLQPGTAALLFLGYSALTGVTLSSIFWLYDLGTIGLAFLCTAGMFGGMSIWAVGTKKDLSSWGSFLIMGLWGIIIASIVNIFLRSDAFTYFLSYAGIALFLGLTAYDTFVIKRWYQEMADRGDEALATKLSILGALRLYLDFINIFLYVLRILGRKR